MGFVLEEIKHWRCHQCCETLAAQELVLVPIEDRVCRLECRHDPQYTVPFLAEDEAEAEDEDEADDEAMQGDADDFGERPACGSRRPWFLCRENFVREKLGLRILTTIPTW